RLAPFWKGLSDHQSTWTDAQLVAAVRGLEIPDADAEVPASPTKASQQDEVSKLTLPIAPRARAQSYNSDSSPASSSGAFSNISLSSPSAFASMTRPRAKSFGISRSNSSNGGPVETNIPSSTVN